MSCLSLSGGAIAGIAVGGAVLILILVFWWYFATKNGLISVRNDAEDAFSAMDVHMKKSETLARVTQARNYAMAASSPNERAAAERELASSLKVLMTRVQESYPQLKADTQFNGLARQLEQIEHEIAQSRKFYNAKIKMLNNKIEKFPSSIVAGKMGLERRSYFELDDISERNAPRVSFDDAPKTRL